MRFIDSILPKAYFLLLPLTIMVPNWTVIDIKGMLWLYMSILNTLFLAYILFIRQDFTFKIFKEKSFLSFFLFFISCFVSVFFAINRGESLMRITDYFCIISSLFIILFFVKNKLIKPLNIINIVLFTLFLDMLGSYFQLYQVYQIYDYFVIESGGLIKSFYPNKNIASFIFMTKVLIVSNLSIYSSNRFLKIFSAIIIFLTLFIIFLLSTRAMLILISLSLILLITILLIKKFVYKLSFINSIIDFKYFIIPLILSFALFNVTLNNKTDIKVDDRVNSVFSSNDESVNNRVRFYSHAFSQIKLTPIFGIGTGNWRIKSIEYDKESMFSYVVPYSVHNDFLEVFAENGIIGFIPFTLFFFFLFIKILEMLKKYFIENKYFGSVYLLLGFMIIMGDFNLNFPLDRPSSIITYLLFISFIYSTYSNNYEKI